MVVIAHLNPRSIVADGRLPEIASLLSFNNIDILCLSETWLKPQHMNSTLFIPGYQPLIRRDRPAGRGGGVAVYLQDGLTFSVLPVVPPNIECLVLQVRLPRRKLVTVITCYRPPNGNMDNFLDSLDVVINSVQHSNVILAGDLNAKNSEWFALQKTDSEGSALKTLRSATTCCSLCHLQLTTCVPLTLFYLTYSLFPSIWLTRSYRRWFFPL